METGADETHAVYCEVEASPSELPQGSLNPEACLLAWKLKTLNSVLVSIWLDL